MRYPKLVKGYSGWRGANMGRRNVVDNANPVMLHLYRMPMSRCGAYDSGGAYWGVGDPKAGWMYHAYDDDGTVSVFVRAVTREVAKVAILELVEGRFYR
jgi:hypothetical protein